MNRRPCQPHGYGGRGVRGGCEAAWRGFRRGVSQGGEASGCATVAGVQSLIPCPVERRTSFGSLRRVFHRGGREVFAGVKQGLEPGTQLRRHRGGVVGLRRAQERRGGGWWGRGTTGGRQGATAGFG